MRFIPTILLATLGASALPATSHADVFSDDTILPDVLESQNTRLAATVETYFTSDVQDEPGQTLAINRYSLAGAYRSELPTGNLNFGAHFTHSRYALSSDEPVIVQEMGLGGTYSRMLTENWAGFASAGISSGAASGADLEDSIIWAAGGGIQREWSNGLGLGTGAFFRNSPERGDQIAILLSLKWKINERTKIVLDDGLYLSYDLSGTRKTFIEIGLDYDYHEFRLTDDLAVEDSSNLAVIRLHHRLDNGFFVSMRAGVTLDRTLKAWSDEIETGQIDVKSGIGLTLTGGWRF